MIKSEKITKTNLVLGFIIVDLVLLIVGILTWKLFTYKEVIDQISLVSSISSILLALVAIVYAFFQTFSSSKQGEQLQDTLLNIDKKINELNEIKDEFGVIKDEFGIFREASTNDKLELLKVITDMDSRMQGSIESIFNTLKEKQIDVPDQIKQDILSDVKEKYSVSKNKVVDIDLNFLNSKFDHTNKIINEVFLYVVKNYDEGDEVTFEEIENFLISNGHIALSKTFIFYVLNTLVRQKPVLYKDSERRYIRSHFLTNQK